MADQILYPAPDVIEGAGAANRLGDIIAQSYRAVRIFVVSDRGVENAGLLRGPLKSLSDAGTAVMTFSDVPSDPPEKTILRAAEMALDFDAGLVVGLGGGSPLDAAKAVAIMALSEQPIETLYGADKVSGNRLPLVLVPTTAGTGSEATPFTVITRPDGEKVSITARQSIPDLAVLDAALTVGLPRHLTAATGIDAMVHAIEAYTSRIHKNAGSDQAAMEGLRQLIKGVPGALDEPENLAARASALKGSMLAGQAIANAPVGAIHALAYPLGGLHHIHHGLANSLLAPHVMRFNLDAAAELYAELSMGCGLERGPEALIRLLSAIAGKAGIPTTLTDAGITSDDLPRLVDGAMKVTRLLENNAREMTPGDAFNIYRAAL